MVACDKITDTFPNATTTDSTIILDLIQNALIAARMICSIIWPEINVTDRISDTKALDTSIEKLSSI